MSDFKFPCPKCGQNILCDTSNAGMQIPCPVCKVVLTVPPPPPAVPVAGKLSINKTAHHPPPSAAAAGGAPKPAWGAKVEPVKKPKKKIPFGPIFSTLAALAAAAALAWFLFVAPYLKKQAEAKAQAEQARQAQEEADRKAEAERRAAAEAAKIVWKLDLANTPFPDRPAAGKIHGMNFKAEMVLFKNEYLILRQDTAPSRQVLIGLPVRTMEALSGKSFEIATNTVNAPHITLNWKEDPGKPPGAQSFTKGYAMKLEFGTAADGGISGKIFLSLPDAEQSFVAGNFETAGKTDAARPGAPKKPKHE